MDVKWVKFDILEAGNSFSEKNVGEVMTPKKDIYFILMNFQLLN